MMRTGCFAMAVFTLLICASAEASDTKDCYRIADDRDHDGYAAADAAKSEVRVGSRDLRCPDGYRDKADDCSDDDPAVHPRTHEIALNRIDDNCNGLVDEPTFFYEADGSHSRIDSIDISFRINHQAIFYAARSHDLEITVRPVPLSTFDTYTDRHVTRWNITYSPNFSTGRFTLSGLEPGTVWAVRLFFYRKDGSDLVDIGPNGDQIGDNTGKLVDTDWYYTMTDSATATLHKRFQAVTRGLAEYYASQVGEVGYRGALSGDGKGYGAEGNEKWCSEFYVWVTRPFVDGISGTTVDDVMDFFGDHGELYPAREVRAASAGDFLAMDTDEDGDKNHSGMFLAYDSDSDIVWTLEGNTKGNEVRVNQRPFTLPIAPGDGNVLRRLGHVNPSMWKEDQP